MSFRRAAAWEVEGETVVGTVARVMAVEAVRVAAVMAVVAEKAAASSAGAARAAAAKVEAATERVAGVKGKAAKAKAEEGVALDAMVKEGEGAKARAARLGWTRVAAVVAVKWEAGVRARVGVALGEGVLRVAPKVAEEMVVAEMVGGQALEEVALLATVAVVEMALVVSMATATMVAGALLAVPSEATARVEWVMVAAEAAGRVEEVRAAVAEEEEAVAAV